LRGGVWWFDFSFRGKRYRRAVESAENEQQAWDALEQARTETRQGRRFDVERALWPHLEQRLLAHHEAKGTRPRTIARIKQLLAHLDGYFASSTVHEIPECINDYVALRRQQKAAPASIRMEIALARQAFKVAGLVRLEAPAIEVRNVRTGFLEADDVQRIAEHLPVEIRSVVWTAFLTGWRKSEILNLEWRDVNLAAKTVRLWPGTTKDGHGRVFPLGACPPFARLLADQREATSVLERQTGRIVRYVFHRGGCRIANMDDAWRTACKAAGKPGALFHDLRRSFALNMRRLGLSETDIMELAGWKTSNMFRRYCVGDESGLADRLRRAWNGTTPAQVASKDGSGAAG
jgi:integrase